MSYYDGIMEFYQEYRRQQMNYDQHGNLNSNSSFKQFINSSFVLLISTIMASIPPKSWQPPNVTLETT